jgi:hypothetical protein
LLDPLLSEAAFGIADERRHVQFQQQARRIERRLGADTLLGNWGTRRPARRTCLSPYKHCAVRR